MVAAAAVRAAQPASMIHTTASATTASAKNTATDIIRRAPRATSVLDPLKLSCSFDQMMPVFFIVYQTARMGLPRGLSRPICSGLLFLAEPSLPDQTPSKHFGSSYCLLLSSLLSFFSPLVVISSSKSFFILSSSFLGSILSSQEDLPNLKNLDFSLDIHRFVKKQGFR